LIPSRKKLGKYEHKLLRILIPYFENKGFRVFPHVQLNISWGSIISDVDLVAMRNNALIGVEIKSKRDKFRPAFKQTDRICDFFDRLYIASDKREEFLEKNWQDWRIGLLLIKDGQVIERKSNLLSKTPRHSTLVRLRKICLQRLSEAIHGSSNGSKSELASNILCRMRDNHLRLILKSIVTCVRTCETICPIWDFERTLIAPLRNIQKVFEEYVAPKHISPLIPAETDEEESCQE